MMQEGLRHFTETYLTVIGMSVFLLTYIGVVFWTFSGAERKKQLDIIAQLPLQEQEEG